MRSTTLKSSSSQARLSAHYSLLTKVKDPLPKEKLAGVVFPCQCGKVYVGETEALRDAS